MGTIGGSIANSDPAADWPAAILALKANIKTNNRIIQNRDLFIGMFETSLEENEIITSIEIQVPDFFNYIKFPNPASRYAIVGVAIAKYNSEVFVAVSGASHKPFVAEELSESLSKNFSSDIPLKTIPIDELNEDIHASPEYRANLIDVLTKKIINSN
jgi:carbon-monoxide dehydrogenase medium subunit